MTRSDKAGTRKSIFLFGHSLTLPPFLLSFLLKQQNLKTFKSIKDGPIPVYKKDLGL